MSRASSATRAASAANASRAAAGDAALRRLASAPAARRDGYHHGDLRRALLDAALDLTRRQGPGTFTFADLCRAVGVSTAAPYRHFESLDQLMAEAAQEGFAELDRTTAAGFRGADWQARLASCVSDYLGFVRAHPAHTEAMFYARPQTVAEPDWNPLKPLALPPPRNATEAAVYGSWRAGTELFVRYAQRLADALADSPLAAAVATRQRALETALALWTLMQGTATQWLAGSLPDDWLDRGARKAFDKIVLPWALGLTQQIAASSAKSRTRAK
jgi:AcrR family transcriptional regulator